MKLQPLNRDNQESALSLLGRHRETSLFLLGNLADHGPSLGEDLNSANFKCLLRDGQVVAVFGLTRRGNLLVCTDRQGDYTETILAACEEEPIEVQGFIGDWEVVEPLWRRFSEKRPDFRADFVSRDLLFRKVLAAPTSLQEFGIQVRLLAQEDFEAWDRGQRTYQDEEGIPEQGTVEQRRRNFAVKAAKGHWWGAFVDGELAAMAGFNAYAGKVAQVGGVYTYPAFRRRGLSRRTMEKLIADGIERHGLESLILFTGPDNVAAQQLYRSLGFEEIGHFGLIFGRVPKLSRSELRGWLKGANHENYRDRSER